MWIAPNGEGEATVYLWRRSGAIRTSQGATGKNCFLRVIESNRAELLPITDKGSFSDNLMDGQLALNFGLNSQKSSCHSPRRKQHTSLICSIGTLISSASSLLPRKISPVLLQQHAGIAMLANSLSYSIKLLSNHISTRTSSMSFRDCMRSRNLGLNRSNCRRIFIREAGWRCVSMY